jgi:hypothetical protein
MYFHSPTLTRNIEIHGIGVGVERIPQEYLKMKDTNEMYYMVNSHRYKYTKPDELEKVLEVERPNGPSLVLYRVKPL